ncbi:DUF1961 family protein [Enterococcus timonensis]|uniref:DUF1961 family protein n=1 Tax=Enterococcus timonensis TaxID=1852364 RepID=UPI0008D9A6C4|nr:DUF1961 family protein [Enterococcus timonensis]
MEERLIYQNFLRDQEDIKKWIPEGNIKKTFENGLVLESADDLSLLDHAHFTYWLPEKFPANIKISWEFLPLEEPGLCMMFFSALGKNGESIFDTHLAKRDGYYPQYHSGDINAYHISYFRHKQPNELAFRTCNLRKSAGFNFIIQGGDPLPPVEFANDFYHLEIYKFNGEIRFFINELEIFSWKDNGKTFGPVLEEGFIGLRQMAPMKAKYRNLQIYHLKE